MAISIKIKEVNVHVGDIVRVHLKIQEGRKREFKYLKVWSWLFVVGSRESDVYCKENCHWKCAVERIFPVNSPWIVKIEVKKTGDVRRAKVVLCTHKISSPSGSN